MNNAAPAEEDPASTNDAMESFWPSGRYSECPLGHPWLEVSRGSVKVCIKFSPKFAGFPVLFVEPFLK